MTWTCPFLQREMPQQSHKVEHEEELRDFRALENANVSEMAYKAGVQY